MLWGSANQPPPRLLSLDLGFFPPFPFRNLSHSLHWLQLGNSLSWGYLAAPQARCSLATPLSQLRQHTLTFTFTLGREALRGQSRPIPGKPYTPAKSSGRAG